MQDKNNNKHTTNANNIKTNSYDSINNLLREANTVKIIIIRSRRY